MVRKVKNNVAYILKLLCSITGDKPGKTTLQKMVYLIQMEGLDLGFKYKPHCYGVYCEALDSSVNSLAANNIIHIEKKGNSYLMDVDNTCIIESDLGKENEIEIENIIIKYKDKTPSESGLLTTAHYISKKLAGRDLPEIINGVQKIVGNKYSEEIIKEVIQKLN